VISYFEVLGGMALFLYGVRLLSTGMEKLAGNQIQVWFDRMTDKPLKGAFFGVIATALIRSSGVLMVTMIGLINANLMTLEQAIGVMMGQEIGTTITAQIVAFHIGDFCYLLIAIGLIMIEFAPRRRWHEYGEIILGFGVLFLGMNLMAGSLKVLAELPGVKEWLASMGQNPLLGVLAGTIATAVVQSSSVTTGLIVAMGMSQTITLPGAISLILGANIGSCIMGLLASARLSRASRRASIAQILINVIGVLLFLPFVTPFANLVSHTSSLLPRQIANAHTIFNITVSIVLFPFIKVLARLSEWLVPRSKAEEKPKLAAYIDVRQYSMASVALTEAARELNRLGEVTAQMIEHGHLALTEEDLEAAQWVLGQETEFVDPLCATIDDFLNTLMQGDLSVDQQKRCFQLKSLIGDMERVGDLAENMAEAAQKKAAHQVAFSLQAQEELEQLFQHAYRTYQYALQAVREDDETLARRVCWLEEEFDQLHVEARQRHIDRLNAGVCQPEANVIFIEALRNLERISDHADNLGISVMRGHGSRRYPQYG
jgi:phosphate:Na+ symporter